MFGSCWVCRDVLPILPPVGNLEVCFQVQERRFSGSKCMAIELDFKKSRRCLKFKGAPVRHC